MELGPGGLGKVKTDCDRVFYAVKLCGDLDGIVSDPCLLAGLSDFMS